MQSSTKKIRLTNQIIKPYIDLQQFISNYKPISNMANINKIKQSKNGRFKEDQHGYYYGQVKINKQGKQQRYGQGVYFGRIGTVYQGLWLNNFKHIKGFFKDQNGTFYEGEFYNNKYHGYGTLCFINGDKYDGQWANGQKDGTGTSKNIKGYCYIGQWKKNKIDGFGVLSLPNGDKYQGLFKDNKKSGKGVLRYENKDIYKGYFQQDQFHGFGQFFWANGNYYRGQFCKGLREGPGQLKKNFPNTKSYQGYFKQNMKWGYGVYNWNSGSCYKGFFQRDKRHGYGQMFWPDGSIYRGWWKDGVQHGKGQLFVVLEGLIKGIFNNNQVAVLTEHIFISKEQYEKNSSLKQQDQLPYGIKGKKKSKSKTKKNQHIKKLTQTPKRSFLKNHTKVKTQIVSLDSIEFPLLFHHHSRLKRQRASLQEQKNQSKVKERKKNKIELLKQYGTQRQKQKRLHSVLGVHKDFVRSSKFTQTTMPSINMTFWNEKKFLNLKVQDIQYQKLSKNKSIKINPQQKGYFPSNSS